MPSEHAKLSPSAAERWLVCPGSVGLSEQVPEPPSSPYAEEGTCAHALAELKASYLILGEYTSEQYHRAHRHWKHSWAEFTSDEAVLAEMEIHTDAYVELLKERLALYPNSHLSLEQRLDTGVPSSWGTSDAVISSPFHIEIVDFKYGSGVQVMVECNPQLRLYGVGALDAFEILGDLELVRITVHQPRIGRNGYVATEEITPEDLREWRSSILPVAEEALGPDAHFQPSEDACRWCPASGRCQAQIDEVFSVPFDEKPKLMTPEQMGEVRPKVKMIENWLNAFEEASLHTAYSEGKAIPGYKVVLSGGRRYVADHETAEAKLINAGYDRDEIMTPRKVKGIGDLESLLGEEDFERILVKPGVVKKSEGKPALVPESDKRPAINPDSEAQKAFSEIEDDVI